MESDQGAAMVVITIRLSGSQSLAGLSATRGLAALRAYLMVSVNIIF
jgi:hypothetical protein